MDTSGNSEGTNITNVTSNMDIEQQKDEAQKPESTHDKKEGLPENVQTESPTGLQLVRLAVDAWRKENNYIKLIVAGIHEEQYQISFKIGPNALPFSIHLNQDLKVLFITSDSSALEEYTTPINYTLEESSQSNNPPEITQVLTMLALHFKETEQKSAPPPPPFMTNFPIRRPLDQPQREQKPKVIPTVQDFEQIIFPEVRQALQHDNFMEYEIQEWIRRVQGCLKRGNIKKALETIRDEILAGNIPESILHFFPKRKFRYTEEDDDEESFEPMNEDESKYVESGGTPAAIERLKIELMQLKELNTKELGYTAAPSGNDLFHWHVRLFGFGSDTPLGQQLTEWALKHTDINDTTKHLDQDILIEMKFPANFPMSPPLCRIVHPRFTNIEVDLTTSSNAISSTTTTTTTTTSSSVPLSSSKPIEIPQARKTLSVSRAIEKSTDSWNPTLGVADYIQQIRSLIIESGAQVDIEAGREGYSLPTVGNFWRSFSAVLPGTFGRKEVEDGGKIILPMSALEDLSQDMDKFSHPFFGGISHSGGFFHGPSPMLFEISTEKGKRSFCGVEEFTAEEGSIVLPSWMLNNLGALEGAQVQVRRVNLPKGTYVKLQPHTTEFLEVNDTKAMLEWVLPKFVVMSVGYVKASVLAYVVPRDTIVISYRQKKYAFNILEVKPGRAIHIIDSDVTTEFAPPLSGIPSDFSYTSTATIADSPMKDPPAIDKLGKSPSEKLLSKSPADKLLSKSPGTAVGTLSVDSSQKEGIDFKICDNCKRNIPITVYNNHTLSCARMNWFCDACQIAVPKAEKEKHMSEAHTIVFCECGARLESRMLTSHKENDCPKRIVRCSFCPLEMSYIEKYEHELKCGSQTEKCDTCKRYIQRRDLLVHMVECIQQQKQQEQLSKEFFPPRYRQPVQRKQAQHNEDIFSCPTCMAPFEHLDDLQVHMMTEHYEEKVEKMEEETKPTDPQENITAVSTQEPTQDQL